MIWFSYLFKNFPEFVVIHTIKDFGIFNKAEVDVFLELSSEQDPASPSVSLSHQEASISLLSLSIRGQTDLKPQSQKTNQLDHMDHSLA